MRLFPMLMLHVACGWLRRCVTVSVELWFSLLLLRYVTTVLLLVIRRGLARLPVCFGLARHASSLVTSLLWIMPGTTVGLVC